MKRLIIFALFFVGFAHATTSVTGKIQTLGTGNITSGAFARFWLRGCGGNQPRINGTATIGPSQGGVFYFDISADSGGNVTGTIYSTRDATGLLGGEIECGGSKLSVWYGLQIFVGGKGGPESPVYAKNSATLDITQVTPITTNPVVPSPTGDSTYARLDGGNQPFTGNISPSGNGTLNMGTSTNRWKLFASTLDASSTLNVTGNSTLGGTLGVTGATTLSSTLGVTGNTTVGGTLNVTGISTLSSLIVSGNASFVSLIGQYNNISTVGNGISSTYFQDDQTGLTATRGPIAVLTGAVGNAGHWHVCYVVEVTTADASGRTVTFSTAYTSRAINRTSTGTAVAVSSTANSDRNCFALNIDASTGISYTVTASGAFTTAQYAVDVWVAKE